MNKGGNQKTVIILAAIAGLLLVSFGVVWTWSYNEEIQKNIEAEKKKLKNYSAIVEKKAGIEAKLEYLNNKRSALDERWLSGDTPAVAAADLQTILNDMASELELIIDSQRIITPRERGIILEVPVQITTRCTITKLKDLLYQIESYNKFLSISNLDVQVVRAHDPKDVKSTIDVSGFILKP